MQFAGFCLITENVPGLVCFYEAVFGCKADGGEMHAELSFAGVNVAIFSKQGMEQMAPGCMQQAGYGSVTLMFAVEDVDVEFERLKTLGVDFCQAATESRVGRPVAVVQGPGRQYYRFYVQDSSIIYSRQLKKLV